MTLTGLDLLWPVIGFAILLALVHILSWCQRDRQRRFERLQKRGLA